MTAADAEQIIPFTARLIENDIAEAVKIIESLPTTDVVEIITVLPLDLTTRLLSRLQTSYAARVLQQCDKDLIRKVLSQLVPAKAASVIMHMTAETRAMLIPSLNKKLADEVRELLTYPEGSIGRIMTMDYLAFKKEEQAGEVIEKLRKMAHEKSTPVSYAYVVDGDYQLYGVLNIRDLMLAEPDQALESFMISTVFSLHCFTDRTEAAREMAKRKYFAVPVVDGTNRLIGLIKAENLLHGIKEDITSDIQKMFGVGGDERTFSPVGQAMKKRLFWLVVNLGTAFLAAAVVAMFEGIIAKLTILAVFLPVIAGQGGNAGAQSLAVVMRGLVMREIPAEKVPALIMKEVKLGAFNGVIIGFITAAIAWGWYGNPWFGLVIGLGMIINLVIAGFAGSSIPLAMKKIGIDPAQSSSIILTTVTDVMGFLAFLGLAVVFQNYLL